MKNEYRDIDLGEEWRMLIISSAVSESYAQQFSEHKTNKLLLKLKELGFINNEPKVHSQLMREIKTLWNDIPKDDRKQIIKYSCEVNKIMRIYRIKVFTKEDDIKEVTEKLARKVRYFAKVIALNDYGRIIGDQFIIDIHKWALNQRANRGHVIFYDKSISDEVVEDYIRPLGSRIDFDKEPLFIKLDSFEDIISKYEEYEKEFINWINEDYKHKLYDKDNNLLANINKKGNKEHMSNKLGMAKLYLNKEDFAKILKLEDEQSFEIINIAQNDTDKTIEFRIITPIDNSKSILVQEYNNHWDVKRCGTTLKDGREAYIPIDKDKLNNYSNEELGDFIKKSYNYFKENYSYIDEVIFKAEK